MRIIERRVEPFSLALIIISKRDMMKKLLLLLPFLLFGESRIVIDDFLDNTTILEKPAKTHIFLSFSEMVAMLDIWDSAVGLSQHVYNTPLLRKSNPNIDTIPKVGGGSGSNLNIEVLKKLNPDIVVVWAGKKEAINFVRNNGINIIAFYPNNISSLILDMRTISKALGKEDLFNKKMKKGYEIIELLQNKTQKIENKKTAIYLWSTPNDISGGRGMVADMLDLIGVENLGKNINTDSAQVSIEQIIKLNPDVIFIWGAAKFSVQDILNNKRFKSIKAIQNKAVYKMPLWDNWGPRILETALLGASFAYSDLYSDINVDKMITDFNMELFGIDER